MIRVKVELLPAGVEELGIEVDQMVICCKFPIDDPTAQDLQVFTNWGMKFADIPGYNLQDTIYKEGKKDREYWELIYRAIGEMLGQNTTRTGEEIYPGMMRLSEDDFNQNVEEVSAVFPEIETVSIFGEKAGTPGRELALMPRVRMNGARIFELYEGYQWRFIAVKLDPGLYKNHFLAEIKEIEITNGLSIRPDPHGVRGMRCLAGVYVFFSRPDGSISCMGEAITKKHPLELECEGMKKYTLDGLRKEIKAGRMIYKRSENLTKPDAEVQKT